MTNLINDPRLVDLIDQARNNDWDVIDDDENTVIIENADRLIVSRHDSGLTMFGSVSYPDEPLYLSDHYPFDLDLAVRFLSGESWAL